MSPTKSRERHVRPPEADMLAERAERKAAAEEQAFVDGYTQAYDMGRKGGRPGTSHAQKALTYPPEVDDILDGLMGATSPPSSPDSPEGRFAPPRQRGYDIKVEPRTGLGPGRPDSGPRETEKAILLPVNSRLKDSALVKEGSKGQGWKDPKPAQPDSPTGNKPDKVRPPTTPQERIELLEEAMEAERQAKEMEKQAALLKQRAMKVREAAHVEVSKQAKDDAKRHFVGAPSAGRPSTSSSLSRIDERKRSK